MGKAGVSVVTAALMRENQVVRPHCKGRLLPTGVADGRGGLWSLDGDLDRERGRRSREVEIKSEGNTQVYGQGYGWIWHDGLHAIHTYD
jgi:hypothetical protein